MAKVLREPYEALYPAPVILVSSIDETGKPNIITLSWAGIVCSGPPMIGISIRPERYSNPLVKKSNEFVVNIPTADQVKQIDYCGSVSGKDLNKFEGANLTPRPASQLRTPMIEECPMNIECRVKQVIPLGVHDLFLGEVVAVHVSEDILDTEGNIDYGKANPLVLNISEYRRLGPKVVSG